MKSQRQQQGYLLITVVVMLFLLATVAVMLTHGSAINASDASGALETDRADYVAQAGMQHALWRAGNNACMGDVTIPTTTLGNDNYTASISGAAPGTAFTLSADQDAWIRSDDVARNNGTTTDQHIRFESGKIEQTLTRFDLSSLPADSYIYTAVAWFYVSTAGAGGGAHPEGPLAVHRITADWTETGATWATMNGNFDSSTLATIAAQPSDGVWVSFNLTGQVQAWVNGQPNYGILMQSVSEGVHAKYSSREDGANAPRLEVVVGSSPASPATIDVVGTLANGNIRVLTRTAAALQPSGIYTFQPDATDGIDSYIWETNKSTNYGTDDETWVSRTSNNASLSLFKFNMSAIPAGSRILSATLSLHNRSGYNSNVPVTAHRITNPWDENSVTWNNRDSGTPWDTAGGDIDPAVFASTNVGPTRFIRYEWEIANLVRGWIDGRYPNHGVALATAMASSVGERFDTSDHPDSTRRPMLTIAYACECGDACLTPRGSGNVVMVVINPTTLVPADAYKKALFESWGYTVDVLSESANQATYDSKAATNDVFFISETVNSNQVGSKLVDVPIGVVTQDGSYNSDLGLAGGSAWPVSPTINVTDTSHYITAIFPAGPLDIYSGAMEQLAVSGGAAAGLQTLADTGGAGSLVALDTGAALLGGGSAAARRVMLPLGREGSVNWDFLNNNGRLIVQRAIDWAMGAEGGSAGSVLLVVVDPASLTAQEQAKKTLIESWGYAVNLIDENDSQANFDAAFGDNDVVYIPHQIDHTILGSKLLNASIGVVNEDGIQVGYLGFATGIVFKDRNAIDVVDNSHYITEPFTTGLLTFVSSDQPVYMMNTGVTPGLQTLGKSLNTGSQWEPSLGTLEANDDLSGGGVAAGRRVQLPWGYAFFDINSLTADGKTIMKRAIEWGSGIGCGSTTSLWMLVADANNPTAEETIRQTLLESWCYAVTLSTASEPQEVYDKYAANFDVVYVAASVNYADVGNKLKLQPIGVVAEPSILSSRLGFTSGTSGYTGTVTELTDDSHYITSGLPLGNLALTTTSTSLRHFTNTMGPGFKTLSVRPTQTNPMIMTLDTGDELLWGGNAPDRRVMLPWGGSSTFDVNNLTDDGLTILQRSLEWVAAEKSLAPIAHWKLDETSGATAVDSAGGHNGILNWNPPWVSGHLDGGLQFNGTNQFVDVPHDAALALNDRMTFTAWVNSANFGSSYQSIIDRDPGVVDSNFWFGTWQDELVFGFWSGGAFREVETFNLDLPINTWHHLAATFDNSSNEVRLYANGVEVQTGSISQNPGTPTSPVWIGKTVDGEYWNGRLDDVRIYDRILGAADIAALAAEPGTGGGGGGGGGGGNLYVEAFQEWSASQDDQWLVQDLSGFGVPPNTVVEVAITNVWSNFEQWAGVRATGSTLDRRLQLHEAEQGGTDALVMHVQTDSNSNIEIYADTTDLVFAVLGYWSSGSFVESWDFFDAGVSGTWADHALNAYGVVPGSVAEVLAHNRSLTTEVQCGVRSNGSSLDRLFDIHEAESGGKDAITLLVNADTDSGATIEAFTEHGGCDFYLTGHWSTPPGVFTESFSELPGSPSSSATWDDKDLTSLGVPGNAVLQIAMANGQDNAETLLGVREKGSTKARTLNLHEAEQGGDDLASVHVPTDANSTIQWFDEDTGDDHRFYLLGWWLPN